MPLNNNTNTYYTPRQLKLPLVIEELIDISDPVYTFCDVVENIDLKKYFASEESRTGRPRCDSKLIHDANIDIKDSLLKASVKDGNVDIATRQSEDIKHDKTRTHFYMQKGFLKWIFFLITFMPICCGANFKADLFGLYVWTPGADYACCFVCYGGVIC